MLSFLSQSPLRDRFAKVLEAIEINGPADLTLDLRIPLKPELGDPVVAGTVDARGATLRQRSAFSEMSVGAVSRAARNVL